MTKYCCKIINGKSIDELEELVNDALNEAFKAGYKLHSHSMSRYSVSLMFEEWSNT